MELVINNRQRTRRLDRKLLKQIAEFTLAESQVETAELGIQFVSAKEMASVHEQFMNVTGSTDVITFDHGSKPPHKLHGEIFISIEDAIAQAREFKTSWQSETARYMAHGILHLLGYDDLEVKARAKMKREENRLVRQLESEFDLRNIEKR
jgi:probable rRNA maturation factor